jgi:hypothetical protein
MNNKIIPIRKDEIIVEIGGPVDECRATLAIYSDNLDPDTVSKMLGCSPSHAHRKDDRRKATSVPFKSGAWFLTVESRAPEGPEEAISKLLGRFPETPEFWQPIVDQYNVSIRVGIHTSGWNRGFGLSPNILAKVGRIGVAIDFDLYFYGDEIENGV